MKIRQRIISALAAASTAISMLSATSFASSLRFDVNGDGYENSKDALYILQEWLFNGNQDERLDVNNDGFVNSKDSLYVLKVFLGLIEPEPVPEPEPEPVPEPEPEPSAAESILEDYEKKWAYNTLSDKQKEAYSELLQGALKCKSAIRLYDLNITTSDLKKVFWACDYDNPLLFNIKDGYSATCYGERIADVNIKYCKTAAQTADTLKKIEQATADVLDEAKKLSSDAERVRLFHDWIINRTVYTLKGESYISETDGPILYGKALCEGYSRAFSYLCQSVGIECVCISGTADGGGHMWNMVKVDGKWYHIDVTWDDPLTSTGEQVLRSNYFLLSDAQMLKDHKISNAFTVPTAPSPYTA